MNPFYIFPVASTDLQCHVLFFCLTKSLSQIWNDYCEAHEAYQFLRKKHTDRYKGGIKNWLRFDKCGYVLIYRYVNVYISYESNSRT